MENLLNRDLPTFSEGEFQSQLKHFTRQGYDLRGIVHAGAHNGGDIRNYLKMGIDYILAFEPLTRIYNKLIEDVKGWPDEIGFHPKELNVYQCGLFDRNGTVELKITGPEDEGQSSTIMEHFNFDHPQTKYWNKDQMFIGSEDIQIVRFDDWINSHPEIDLNNYNTLHLDVQGSEFEALLGMDILLQSFDLLCIELSSIPAYIGQIPADRVVEHLAKNGFRLDSEVFEHGDSFFIKNRL